MGHTFHAASSKQHMEYSCGLLEPGENRQVKTKSFNLEIKTCSQSRCDLQGSPSRPLP